MPRLKQKRDVKKRSAKLKKIVSLAEAEERSLAAMTGRSQKKLNEQQQKLGELNAFRESYATRARSSGGQSSAHWKDYQNFLSRLDRAVRAQQQVVAECEKNLDVHRRRWQEKRQRVESLERVQGRYLEQERVHADRLEQRTQDDLPAAPTLYDEDR